MFLLKFIFIIALIYYLLKSIGKIFLPFLFGNSAKNLNNQQEFKQKKQGDVTIYYKDDKNIKHDTKFGEYVDFEEIKD
jgi:hypothetical protein